MKLANTTFVPNRSEIGLSERVESALSDCYRYKNIAHQRVKGSQTTLNSVQVITCLRAFTEGQIF